MKKKEYMEMEKEYRNGTRMLIIIFIMIVIIGTIVLN